ncbi:MAG: alpha-L-fucosidase [Armatimonadota bacterium]
MTPVTSLKQIQQTIDAGPFAASWESLMNYQAPAWYEDGKLGIFIHWGVYSVPAFGNEWYPRNMYRQGSPEFEHHVATYGPQSRFGYKDFVPRFRAERFDPEAWAELFQQAGARYVVPVAEHHDGFAMYDCSFSRWTAARMGPCRDVLGQLAAAVRTRGLVLGASSHRAEHWWFFDGGMEFDSDVRDAAYHDLYGPAQRAPDRKTRETEFTQSPPDQAFLEDWLLRTCEIVERYRPQLVWFDWWIQHRAFEPYLQKFAAYYYNRGAQWEEGVAINHKLEAFPEGAAVYDIERGQLSDTRPLLWQTDTSVSRKSWGYIEGDEFKSAASIVHDLADIVSKNGCLLLNIGPRPDGTIPEEARRILLELGGWLRVNGEAIYGTRPWRVFGEGATKVIAGQMKEREQQPFTAEDVRFTRKGEALYAICLGWADRGWRIETLKSGAGRVKGVHLLGSGEPVSWKQGADCLAVEAPKRKPCEHAYTLRIDLHE